MEAAIFDEDLVGALAGDDDSREVDSGDVALECCRVADRAAVVGFVRLTPSRSMKAEVGVVAGEGEDEVVRQGEVALRVWRGLRCLRRCW